MIHRLHFIGIGGIGMSGIAEIFLSRGYIVSGSDLKSNEQTERLIARGAKIGIGHSPDWITPDLDAVVYSTAIPSDHVERLRAKKLRIPLVHRSEMLAEVMRGKHGIGIAGTHGKTTTTTLVSKIFLDAGCDPTVVIGGKVEALQSNAKPGAGEFTIVEADESDGSFLNLPFIDGIVTNIDDDHLEAFRNDRRVLNDAFIQFCNRTPYFGSIGLCADDPGVDRILPLLSRNYWTYGCHAPHLTYRIQNITVVDHKKMQFIVKQEQVLPGVPEFGEAQFELGVLGEHNVLNAVGAIGLALRHGITLEQIQKSIKEFQHARRRFDILDKGPVWVIDDYGHHPTEIRAVYQTVLGLGRGRVLMVFEPHRYTRTETCWDGFIQGLSQVVQGSQNKLFLLPIYSAGEQALPGVSSQVLAQQTGGKFCPSFDAVIDAIEKEVRPGDTILCMGAGSITHLSKSLVGRFA